MGAEEEIECPVEKSDVVVAMYQQAPQSRPHIRAVAEAHTLQRVHRVDEAAVMYGQPGSAKYASEQQDVVGDGHVVHD